MSRTSVHPDTVLLHAGRPSAAASTGAVPVNPPVMRASTLLFKDLATMRDVHKRREQGERVLSYGRRATDTVFALEDTLCQMEGGHRARIFSSGLAAISTTFLAFLKPGDHVLISDSVYGPVRKNICRDLLERHSIAYTFMAADGRDAREKCRPETRMIYAESPGSLVYEMTDVPALAALARECGAVLVVDNTWGSAYLHKPLALGADVSVIAGTKYLVGHSDVMIGMATSNERAWQALDRTGHMLGHVVSPDDAYTTLRGIRTLATRLAAHARHAMEVVRWLAQQPEVARVFYPALESDPGHALWKRDFQGACGLVSIELDRHIAPSFAEVETLRDGFIDRLELFGLGASWGGYESLVLPVNLSAMRTVTDWSDSGPVIRFHIGLEHPTDLIADLRQALMGLRQARSPEPVSPTKST